MKKTSTQNSFLFKFNKQAQEFSHSIAIHHTPTQIKLTPLSNFPLHKAVVKIDNEYWRKHKIRSKPPKLLSQYSYLQFKEQPKPPNRVFSVKRQRLYTKLDRQISRSSSHLTTRNLKEPQHQIVPVLKRVQKSISDYIKRKKHPQSEDDGRILKGRYRLRTIMVDCHQFISARI